MPPSEARRRASRKYAEKNREAMRQRSRDYYYNNKEERLEQFKEAYRNKRNALYEELGGCCVKCGSTEQLEFDHINPASKEEDNISNLPLQKAMAILDKFQLLCHDCHQERSDAQKAAAWKLFCSLSLEEQEALL